MWFILRKWHILLPIWSYLWIVCRSSGWHYSLQLGHLESIKVLGSLRFPNFVLSKALSTFYQLIKYCKFGYLSFLVYGVWESKSNLLVAYSIWWQVIVFRCMSLRFDLQCSFEQSNYVTQPFMIYRGAWHILDLPFSYDNNCYSIFFVLIQLLYVSNFVLFVCPTTNDKLNLAEVWLLVNSFIFFFVENSQ